MKRIIFTLSLCIVFAAASAQLYVRANVGYNFPMNSDVLGQNYSYNSNNNEGYVEKFKTVYGSYGAGLSFRAAVGGSISKGIFGYDVEVGYLSGKSYKSSSTYEYNGGGHGSTDTKTSATSFQIAPSLTFTTGEGKFQPFARVGPMIAFNTIKESGKEFDEYDGTYTQETEYKYKGGMSFGFKGVLGVSYSIAPKTSLYVELDVIGLSYAPNKREMTKYVINGNDVLSTVDPKVVDLKKDYETNSQEGDPPVRESHSMGSAGLQVGVKFFLK